MGELRCEFCGKKAIARFNNRLVCRDCGHRVQVSTLRMGGQLLIAVQGEPVALVIPNRADSKQN